MIDQLLCGAGVTPASRLRLQRPQAGRLHNNNDGAGPDVLEVLNPLLDHRQLIINARPEVVPAADGFWFVGSYNPRYGDAARNLRPDFRQRCRFLSVEYLPREDEAALVVGRTGLERAEAEFLVRVAEVTRTRLRDTLPEGAHPRTPGRRRRHARRDRPATGRAGFHPGRPHR